MSNFSDTESDRPPAPGRPMPSWLKRLATATAVIALPLVAAPATAHAATPCAGQVCLYDDQGSFVGSYRDVTGGWQSFSRVRTASAVNGFTDNAVYFKHQNGQTSCIQPQRTASVNIAGYGPVVALWIVSNGNCYPGGVIAP
jgi:hypothetical protein